MTPGAIGLNQRPPNVMDSSESLKEDTERAGQELEEVAATVSGVTGTLRGLNDHNESRSEALSARVMEQGKRTAAVVDGQKGNGEELKKLNGELDSSERVGTQVSVSLEKTQEDLEIASLDGGHSGSSSDGICKRISNCCKRTLYITAGAITGGIAGYGVLQGVGYNKEFSLVGAAAGAVVVSSSICCIIKCKDLSVRCWTKLKGCCRSS